MLAHSLPKPLIFWPFWQNASMPLFKSASDSGRVYAFLSQMGAWACPFPFFFSANSRGREFAIFFLFRPGGGGGDVAVGDAAEVDAVVEAVD